MKAPKTPEDQILAAIVDLSRRQAQLEILMNEMVAAQTENASLIQALIDAVRQAPQVLLGGVEVDAPPDLNLNSWIEAEKKRRGD